MFFHINFKVTFYKFLKNKSKKKTEERKNGKKVERSLLKRKRRGEWERGQR